MTKTVAIVVNTSWNIYNFRLGLLGSLREAGYRIVVIAPMDDYSGKLEVLGFEYHPITMNNKGTNPVEDLKLTADLYRLYREIRPDVLLHYTIKPNIYGTIAAKLAGIPVISNISGLGTVFLNDALSSKIARGLYRFVLRFPEKVFFQNPQDRQLFVHEKLVREERTALLPGSGIDTRRYRPAETQKPADVPFVFLLIARMVKDKGVVEFVHAARQVRQMTHHQSPITHHSGIEFRLLGSLYPGNPTAVSEEELSAWEEEGIVRYLGHTDDVAGMIAASDCIVLPSYREGLSRVLLEAAAMAKPVITTDAPGCRDVVDDGVNGYLCKVKDAAGLAEQMEKMLALSDEDRMEMGRRGRQKVVAEFDEQIVIGKYREAIDEILESK